MSLHKQAARKGDDCSLEEGRLKAREAPSSLHAMMAVLLQGLLSETSRGSSRTPQVGALERTAIAAPLCMWPASLSTGSSEEPAEQFKRLLGSPAPVSMLCKTGS